MRRRDTGEGYVVRGGRRFFVAIQRYLIAGWGAGGMKG
jgi:hypothetical protein